MINIFRAIQTFIDPYKKAYFLTSSLTTVSVGVDSNNPSYITGLGEFYGYGFELSDPSTGAIKNISGRKINLVTGTINFNPDKSGGGTTLLKLVSERSVDGINWTPNIFSKRPIEIPNNGESYGTKLSLAIDWENNEFIRFRVFSAGGGAVDFVRSDEIVNNTTYTTPSVTWQLTEN